MHDGLAGGQTISNLPADSTAANPAQHTPAGDQTADVLAAVDLGSNSFHMIVGELRHGQLVIIDRLKETVRLSEGLEKTGELTDAARSRALECLSRFGERLRHIHASNVRVAGTSTFRRAKGSEEFCKEAALALGHPLEIISGREEARLIYAGVTHSTPPYDGLRLVLDIGGGSTELILGQANEPRALESLNMGCVLMTERHFRNGKITRAAIEEARLVVRLKLRPVKAYFRDLPDIEAIGTSGTIRATAKVARGLKIIDSELTLNAVEQLIDRLCDFNDIESLKLPGLSERRAQVWPGGLAILVELLSVLRIDHLKTSEGALREGLLYDSVGRLQHEDARERTVQALGLRYHVDGEQAQRVANTTGHLLDQCAGNWNLTSSLSANMLEWSALLHEIGLDISHDGFQRHGAYIAENADLPGFPRAEQKYLAFLIASQRRQIDTDLFEELPSKWQKNSLRLAIVLRLSVLLNRSRSRVALPLVEMDVTENALSLDFPRGWLKQNPLTHADLEKEKNYLAGLGYELLVNPQ